MWNKKSTLLMLAMLSLSALATGCGGGDKGDSDSHTFADYGRNLEFNSNEVQGHPISSTDQIGQAWNQIRGQYLVQIRVPTSQSNISSEQVLLTLGDSTQNNRSYAVVQISSQGGPFIAASGRSTFTSYLSIGMNGMSYWSSYAQGYQYGFMTQPFWVSSLLTSSQAVAFEFVLALSGSNGGLSFDRTQSHIRIMDCGLSSGIIAACTSEISRSYYADFVRRY